MIRYNKAQVLNVTSTTVLQRVLTIPLIPIDYTFT